MVLIQQNGIDRADTECEPPKLTPSEFKAYNRLADRMDMFVSFYHPISFAHLATLFDLANVTVLTGPP